MNVLKRVIPLTLAILMVLGTMSAVFPLLVQAADFVPLLGTGHRGVNPTGTPDGNEFDEEGTFDFTVGKAEEGDQFTLTVVKPSRRTEILQQGAGFTISGNTITYGGLTLTKPSGVWGEGDTFSVKIKEASTGKEPLVSDYKLTSYKSSSSYDNTDRTNKALTSISKGVRANIFVTVIDPNFQYSEIDSGKKPYVNLHSSSFKAYQESDTTTSDPIASQIIITPTEVSGGKLAFEVTLTKMQYTGVGKAVTFTYGYYINGENFEQTVTVTMSECKEYVEQPDNNEDDDDEELNLDPLTPHIIVSNYDYGALQVAAGQSFDLDLTFTNTSDRYNLENIIMKIDTGEGFSITSSSNSFYIDSLKIGESISKVLNLQAMPSAKAQSYPININFSFQYLANDTRKSGESAESISIPITQPDRFTVNELQTPTMLYQGDEYPLSATFVNKGKADIYNVTAELRGNISNNGERQFIGNVASGTESSADFYITASEPGTITGEIVISYEDSNMNIKEVTKPFTIEVQGYEMPVDPFPGEDPNQGMPVDGEVEEASPWTAKNIGLGLSALVIAGMSGYLTVMKIKAKRSEIFDEDI